MYNLDVDIVSFDGVDCFEIMSIENSMKYRWWQENEDARGRRDKVCKVKKI